MPVDLDQVRLNFSPAGLTALNMVLALVMFGISLDLDMTGFRRLRAAPRAPIAGLVAQFVAFPAATWILIQLLHPAPSVALGEGPSTRLVAHRDDGDRREAWMGPPRYVVRPDSMPAVMIGALQRLPGPGGRHVARTAE